MRLLCRERGGNGSASEPRHVVEAAHLKKPLHLQLKERRVAFLKPTTPDHLPNGIDGLQGRPQLYGGVGLLGARQVKLLLEVREELRRHIERIAQEASHLRRDAALTSQQRVELLFRHAEHISQIAETNRVRPVPLLQKFQGDRLAPYRFPCSPPLNSSGSLRLRLRSLCWGHRWCLGGRQDATVS